MSQQPVLSGVLPNALPDPENILVAVAMSGGVDSSVAALLLKRAGYRVVGLTMKLWSPPPASSQTGDSCDDVEKTCCTVDSAMDAKRVCDQLGIPHYTLDMQEDFEDRVIRPFYEAYLQGETPNPCVNCNSFVKWDALWQRAKAIGADYIATGHYAATISDEGFPYILRADARKDQSYFLWGIPPESLAKTLFPLSTLSKPEVRALASEIDLRTAHKSESQDICFVPKGNYRTVIADRAEGEGTDIPVGAFIGPDGETLGEHKGLPFYTVGQRKGLGIAAGEPLFVRKLDTESNTVVLGRKEELYSHAFIADRFNGFGPDWSSRECLVQYRYRSPAVPALAEREENGRIRVTLREPGYCVAPGQSAVFYDGDRLLGGARIREVL